MKKANVPGFLIYTVQIVLGMMFIYAALDKIFFPARFAEVIYHYKVLPLELLNLCAICIPWIEFGLGILLVFDLWADIGAFLLAGLTIIFILLIFSAMTRGLNIECGCFSLDSRNSFVGWERIFEDLLILFGSGFIFYQKILSR